MRFERTLLTGSGERVLLYIEQVASERENEGSCRVGLKGAELDSSTIIRGIDSLQALLLAVRHLPSFVERVQSIGKATFIWDCGNDERDLGLEVEET